jgi:hypothetical protein
VIACLNPVAAVMLIDVGSGTIEEAGDADRDEVVPDQRLTSDRNVVPVEPGS